VRWVGGLTVSQLHALLDDVTGHGDTPRALLVLRAHADSLYGVANYGRRRSAFDGVLAAAPPAWRGYARVGRRTIVLALRDRPERPRPDTGREAALPRLGGPRPASAVALSDSARPGRYRTGSFPIVRAAIAEFENATLELVEDRSFQTAADDRSGAWITLLATRHESAGFARGAPGSRRSGRAFLDGEAARARHAGRARGVRPAPLSRRHGAGPGERAIPMLLQSERDLPGDYNPPARLAPHIGR